MRTYERTHSWLKFELDLRRASYRLWRALGEAQSKCEHIAGVPLRPSTANELHRLYLAKGVAATTAIEGNALTEQEVLRHVEGKLKVPPSKEYLLQEVENIIQACNKIGEPILKGEPDNLSLRKIKDFNRMVLNNLTLEKGVVPGKIRTHPVVVAKYRGAPAEDCEFLLERLCEWLNGKDFRATEDMAIAYGILKAIVAHIYLAWIHPFGDGNGRTARLVEFQILVAAGVPTPAAHLLSTHYNLTRQEYYRQLEQTSLSGGSIIPFIEYAVFGFLEELKNQIERIRYQQWDVAWDNYIHDQFHGKTGQPHERRRHLALDISEQDDPIPLNKIREISPRIAAYYASKTQKTISRDLNELSKMGLIEKTPQGIRARKEIILAFLPKRRMKIPNESGEEPNS